MSVLFTESFTRYQRRAPVSSEVNNDLATGGLVVRSYASNLEAPPFPLAVDPMRWEVIADPVYASRNALKSFAGTYTGAARAVTLSSLFPARTHWILGARVSLARTTPGATSCILTFGSQGIRKAAVTANTLAAARPTNIWDAAFQIDCITGETYTGVSGAYVLTPYVYTEGADIYVEIEIDTVANLVRVWVNDLLIVDSVFGAGVLAAAKAAYDVGFGLMPSASGSSSGSHPLAIIRDMYCLAVDGTAPFQRLGPTTQVIGEVPTDDVEVDFTRPGGYATNAEVAALPVVPSPPAFLTADQVGQTDLYGVSDSEVSVSAAQVYAVGVKTQLANFAAAAHSVGAVVRSNAVDSTATMAAITPGAGFVNRSAYFTVNPDTEAPWTPQEAADAEFGLTVLS